jgi:amino-acid N-acetyltransferase
MLRAQRVRSWGRTCRLLRGLMSAPSVSLRPGESADLPAVIALLQGAGLPTADLARVSGLRVWVLAANSSLVGVIALERFGADALLRSLAISPEYRKRGFGRELVARLERDAHADRVERLVLLTETAEPFFRALGYDAIDRAEVSVELKHCAEFRSLCPASAVCMSKRLPT